jgi:hypothetical protein
MGDSPFSGDAHPTALVRADIEEDLRRSRRKLDHIIARLKDTADDMVATTGKSAFCKSDVEGLCRIITRLASATDELIHAGF